METKSEIKANEIQNTLNEGIKPVAKEYNLSDYSKPRKYKHRIDRGYTNAISDYDECWQECHKRLCPDLTKKDMVFFGRMAGIHKETQAEDNKKKLGGFVALQEAEPHKDDKTGIPVWTPQFHTMVPGGAKKGFIDELDKICYAVCSVGSAIEPDDPIPLCSTDFIGTYFTVLGDILEDRYPDLVFEVIEVFNLRKAYEDHSDVKDWNVNDMHTNNELAAKIYAHASEVLDKTAPYPDTLATENYNLICKEVHLHKDSKLAKWWKEVWPEPNANFGSYKEFMDYVLSKDDKLYSCYDIVDSIGDFKVNHMDLAQALFVEWNMFLEACGCKRIDGRL